jgi:structural maintenance of chromosome 4
MFRPAFYYALRETLVATDLDSAVKIGYSGERRNRVVTLQGQLIDSSGTMSGGGNKVAKGGMSSTSKRTVDATPDQLVKAEAKLAEVQASLAGKREERKWLDDAIAKEGKRLAALQLEAQKLPMEVAALSTQIEELQGRLSELQKAASSDNAEAKKKLQELSKVTELNEKALHKAKGNCASLEAEVQQLKSEIDNIGGTKLRLQKHKVESLNQRLDETAALASKCKVQSKTGEKAVEKAKQTVEKAEKELEENSSRMEATKAEFKTLEDQAFKVMEKWKEMQGVAEAKKESLEEAARGYETSKVAMEKMRDGEVDIENKLVDAERELKKATQELAQLSKRLEQLRKQFAEALRTAPVAMPIAGDDAAEPVKDALSGFDLAAEAMAGMDEGKLANEIVMLEEDIRGMKPNLTAIAEWQKKYTELQERIGELNDITGKRDAARKLHDELRKQRLDEFMIGFTTITTKLKEMYQMITLGGDAELEFVDSLDPFAEGIVFSVRPPKKSWKQISNLSGGEKTLSSLALVFALHHYKPTPLYVMDEIDAALDFKNVSIVANYIKERTQDAQFIIISLRNNMFELADRLVGVYKTHNSSKTVAINPHQIGPVVPIASA